MRLQTRKDIENEGEHTRQGKTRYNANKRLKHKKTFPAGSAFFLCTLIQSERARKENRFLLIAESASFHAEGIQAHTVRGPCVAVPSMLVESNIAVIVVNVVFNLRARFVLKAY